MVLDIILGIIIIAQTVLFYWRELAIVRERREMIQAVLAKSATEFSVATQITKPKKEEEKDPEDTTDIPADLTPESEASQEDWMGAIEKINEN